MTNLSPKAQAVKDAAWASFWSDEAMAPNDAQIIAAAVLAAAADQVVPVDRRSRRQSNIRAKFLAIADELGGQP